MRRLPEFRSAVEATVFSVREAPSGTGEPDDGRSAALEAWARRLPKAGLVRLVWDSDERDGAPPPWLPGEQAAAFRDTRQLCFEGVGLRLALVMSQRSPYPLSGWLWPPLPDGLVLRLQGADGDRCDVRPVQGGRIAVPAVSRGPMRLVLYRRDEPLFATSWVLVG